MNLSLKNKGAIANLFDNGKRKFSNNVMIIELAGTPGFLFTVSKKKFKRAVDRNRIKRLLRESVKGIIPTKSIALVYVGNTIPTKITINL